MSEPRGRPRGRKPRLSLRSRFILVALAGAAATALGFLTLIGVSVGARERLDRATESFLEEEQIADRISLHVMDQMVAASALRARPDPAFRHAFEEAGRHAHTEIRRFLFRDLSSEERLQVETMAEAHQRMEVAALRAADLAARDRSAEAEASWTAMMRETREFLEGMTLFLGMRTGALEGIREEQWEVFQRVLLASVLLALLVVGAAAGLGWMVHRRVGRPLATLVEASGRMAAGDLTVRVPPWPDRELHQVSVGFNRMARGLEEATGALEKRNRELSAALDRLRRTRDELVQAEKLSALGRMSAGLAHELNNPLTSVIGYSRLLEDELESLAGDPGADLDRVREELLDPIVAEANRAQQLVRNLLHFTRRAEARLAPVDLRTAIEAVVALRERAFRDEGVELRVGELPRTPVLAEPSLLQAACLNLVNNARDALAPAGGGVVRIRGEEEDGAVHLIFEDEGPGISDPEQVFEPFYTTKPLGEGTGLGLSLVHRFMEQFGGSVRAENRPEGGARFVLTFRRAEEGHSARARDPTAASALGTPAGSGTPVPLDADPAAPGADVGTVLVLEDEEPIRKLHGKLLRSMGLRPLLADSAAEARALLEGGAKPEAVLCDVRMPQENGFEFYRWLEGARPGLARHLLFVTGDVGDPELLALLAERPGLFLHKPFSVEEYRERVQELMPAGSGRRG